MYNDISPYFRFNFNDKYMAQQLGFSDIELWKKLFSLDRIQRLKSIMKPSEVKEFEYLPYFITVYRAKSQEKNNV